MISTTDTDTITITMTRREAREVVHSVKKTFDETPHRPRANQILDLLKDKLEESLYGNNDNKLSSDHKDKQ